MEITLTDIAYSETLRRVVRTALFSTKWVISMFAHVMPKILTEYYNARLMELSVIRVTPYCDQGQQCLEFHVTVDEKWVDNATPENPAEKSP
jgi:hypothetical protein